MEKNDWCEYEKMESGTHEIKVGKKAVIETEEGELWKLKENVSILSPTDRKCSAFMRTCWVIFF